MNLVSPPALWHCKNYQYRSAVWNPLRHMIALRRRAKRAHEYDSSFFSAILPASCLIVRIADGPALPCRKTRAENSSRRQDTAFRQRHIPNFE